MGTSHSIELTGLDPNTTYYYRVTSADAAVERDHRPRRRPAAAELHHPGRQPHRHHGRRLLRRDARTPNGYVSETGDGEVMLKPAVGAGVLRRAGAADRLVERDLGVPGRRSGRQRHCLRRQAPRRRRLRRHRRDLRPGPLARVQRDLRRRSRSSTSASPTTSTASGRSSAPTTRATSSSLAPTPDREASIRRFPGSLIGYRAPLPDRVGRRRGPLLRRRQPGRHPRRQLRARR